MDDLKNKITSLKKKIAAKSKEDKKLREALGIKLAEIFGNKEALTDYIRDFYLQTNKLIIVALNKSIASELFFRKQQILESLQSEKIPIEDIIIK